MRPQTTASRPADSVRKSWVATPETPRREAAIAIPRTGNNGFSSDLKIPGPVASEPMARPDLASEGRGQPRQTLLGPTPPSPVTLEHGPRERMEKMLS